MKGNQFVTDLLGLIFNGTTIANLAINATASPLANLYAALHTADPGNAGNQTTNEAAYGSYARQAIARDNTGFTVSGQSASLAATVSFPACTSGTETETHFSVGTALSGAGKILYSGPIGSNQGEFTALASSDTLTLPNVSGVAVDNQMSFYGLPGGTLPTGITQGTLYFVKTISGSQITLSATSGGTTLNITADGDGVAFLHTPVLVTAAPSVTPQLTTGTTISER